MASRAELNHRQHYRFLGTGKWNRSSPYYSLRQSPCTQYYTESSVPEPSRRLSNPGSRDKCCAGSRQPPNRCGRPVRGYKRRLQYAALQNCWCTIWERRSGRRSVPVTVVVPLRLIPVVCLPDGRNGTRRKVGHTIWIITHVDYLGGSDHCRLGGKCDICLQPVCISLTTTPRQQRGMIQHHPRLPLSLDANVLQYKRDFRRKLIY